MEGKRAWKRRPRAYTKHALTPLRRAVEQLDPVGRIDDPDWLTTLGPVGVALRAWRADIIASLGGEDHVSAQERVVVEVATKTYLLLESVDRWRLAQPSIINKQKHMLFPIVAQRQTLADSLISSLSTLGLPRRTPAPLDLARALLPPLTGARNGGAAPPSPRSAQNGKRGDKVLPGRPRGPKLPYSPPSRPQRGRRRGVSGEPGMPVEEQGPRI